MSTIFLTGGNGQVGSALAQALASQGHTLHLLLRAEAWHPVLDTLAPGQLRVFRGNLLNAQDVSAAMADCEQVFHVAGSISYLPQDAPQMQKVNVEGTQIVLQAALAHGVKKLVHTSSTAAIGYAQSPRALSESDALPPRLQSIPYLATKAAAESEVHKAIEKGLMACMVNPATILGAGDTKGNSGKMFAQIEQGRVMAPPGGSAVVSLPKVIEGHLLAMTQLDSHNVGERYILSSFNWDYPTLFRALAEARGQSLGSIPVLPRWSRPFLKTVGKVAAKTVPRWGLSGDVIDFSFAYRYYTAQKAMTQLGWEPDTPKTLQSALRDAFSFYDAIGFFDI